MTITDDLEKLYAEVLADKKNEARAKNGMMAQAFIVGPGEALNVVMMSFRNDHDKQLMCAMVDKFCAERQARGLVYFSETWMARVSIPKGQDFQEARRALPRDLSEAPGRKEGILGLLLTHGWQKSYMTEIVRGAQGEIVRFEPDVEGPAKMKQNMFHYFVQFAM